MPDPRKLVATLAPPARQALELAAERAVRETHEAIEPEHLLLELLRATGSGAAALLREVPAQPADLIAALEAAIARFPRGSPRLPGFSAALLDVLTAAWLIASVDCGLRQTGSVAILVALAQHPQLRASLLAAAPAVSALFDAISRLDPEGLAQRSASDTALAVPGAGIAGGSEALAAYTIDLTAEARAGRLDGAIGREAEIRQVIDVLMRRRQNNPLLAGPSGVGKTALVEGLACRIAAGRVPPLLQTIALRRLDPGLLQAGAIMRGDVEQRLRAVLDEAASASPRIILFIDEAHMLAGGGGQAGAASLLKPALARGGLGVIATTTWGAYKRFIETDPALSRLFQVIRIAEPQADTAVAMLRGLAPKLEAHHGVPVLEEALSEAVRLSQRYLPDRHLPEKAIAVLDTACARAAIACSTPPQDLEAAESEAEALGHELARLEREAALQIDHTDRLEALERARDQAEERRLRLGGAWALEQEARARLRALEQRLEAGGETGALREAWAGLRLELEEMQRDRGAPPQAVDARAIADVISGWTGIPVGGLRSDTVADARALQTRLAERVVDQGAALETICRRIQTFYADLGEPGKPTGVFLLCGPSGVGKTETALALADLLFGGTRALITVNMSEYQEAHTVSSLRGAPPGYVGYGRGGVLTEAVRRLPYAVLLLDEVEKAHPDVLEMFYQVFDRGMLEDAEGQLVDFSHTLILLTSNVGAEALHELIGRHPGADAAALTSCIRPALQRHFPAALLGRLIVVPYRPLGIAGIEAIARLKLRRIQERFAAGGRGELTYHAGLPRAIAEQAGATDTGARRVDAILTDQLLPALSARILDRLAERQPIAGAHLSPGADGGIVIELRA